MSDPSYLVTMGDQFKLDDNGTCQSCSTVSLEAENLQCYMCKGIFHGACPNLTDEDRVGTKSLISNFKRPSTKLNFKFFCHNCLTKFEIIMVNTETNRLNTMEGNINSIKSELEEIKTLLKQNGKPATNQGKSNSHFPTTENIWFNKSRLESTKVSPAEPMLVLNNAQEVNESVEKAIVENSIPVTKSFKNNSGKLVVVCDTQDSRDKLQNIIATSSGNIEMKPVTRKKPSVTIVGLSKKYTKEEVVNQIVSQNQFVKHFSTVNDINEHIEIHDVKPTRAKTSVFQVFASVSETLRKGFRNYNDKITIGLTNCRIYDRFHVKRCNNCQVLGHYYKECPTPAVSCCAKCGKNHSTNTCNTNEIKCINCSKAGVDSNHTAFDPKCLTLMAAVDKKKKSNEKVLNTQRSMMGFR